MNNHYTAKFIPLTTVIYSCYDIYVMGGGGGGGQECSMSTTPKTSVNIEKPFLLPQVFNINSENKVVSVSSLRKNDKTILDALSCVLNVCSPMDINFADSRSGTNRILFSNLPSENLLLRSDLSDFELSPGVYDFEAFYYPQSGDQYVENKNVTQYLFYFEKN